MIHESQSHISSSYDKVYGHRRTIIIYTSLLIVFISKKKVYKCFHFLSKLLKYKQTILVIYTYHSFSIFVFFAKILKCTFLERR